MTFLEFLQSGDESPATSELLSACMQHNEKRALEQIEAIDSLPDSRDKVSVHIRFAPDSIMFLQG